MQDTVSVPANGVTSDVIATQLYRVVNPGARYRLSALGAATGVRVTFLNTIPIINDQAISFNAANQYPVIPDNIISAGVLPGGQLYLTFRNTTGAIIVTGWRLDLA
jgi:hypothetical protein